MVAASQYELIPEAFREIVLQRPLVADDLADFPDDRNRYEIIGGRLIVSPSPTSDHQFILAQLTTWLNLYLIQNKLGRLYGAPMDVRFSIFDVVQPDLLVVLNDRAGIVQRPVIAGAPNLVVEVLSPSSIRIDRVEKAALYAANGVQEYWIVNPETESVIVYALDGDRYATVAELTRPGVLASTVLEGFTLDLDLVFPDKSPANEPNGNE